MHSAWLNESSTLFRRKYYENGSHAGFILYLTDAANKIEDVDNIREQLKGAKGPGNFRNLFMYAPRWQEGRYPTHPRLRGSGKGRVLQHQECDVRRSARGAQGTPATARNRTQQFGTPDTAARVFGRNEIQPLQARFLALHEWLGEEVVAFSDYQIAPH